MSKKYNILEDGKVIASFNTKEYAETYIHGTDRVIQYTESFIDRINMENALIECQANSIEDSQL